MAIYSYSQPSTTEENSVTSQPVYYGFVDKCFCGGRVKLLTQNLASNMGRMFYRCENDSDGPYHISKWWDSSVEEEVNSIKNHSLAVDQQLATITKTNIPSLQNQLDRIENLDNVVLREDVDLLMGKVEKLKTDLECWSAGLDYLIDYYENRSLKDFFLGSLHKLSTANGWILGLSVGLTVSVAANLYLYVN